MFASKSPTVVSKWNQLAQDAMTHTKVAPPSAARTFAILHTAMYDAWSNYREEEWSTTTGTWLKRPKTEWSPENQKKAFSYAAYRVLMDAFWLPLPPAYKAIFKDFMCEMGYDPADTSLAITTPQGIGNISARLALDQHAGDGANQLATLFYPPYSDYTGYRPVNTPDAVTDYNRWQPLRIKQKDETSIVQQFLAPHWGLAKSFALQTGAEFRPVAPAAYGTKEFEAEVEEVLQYSANLTDKQKVISETWMGGSKKITPPAMWCEISQYVSDACKHGEDQDICLFFALSNALSDAGIAAWDCKRSYDSIRPVSAIRTLKKGQKIKAWGGPGKGTVEMDGAEWKPYQPLDFVTPPFAEYVSGHSTFSAAAAYVLKAFTGSDQFGGEICIPKGASFIEPGVTPCEDILLCWTTFSEAAEEAGMSRLYGGIHFAEGNLEGQKLGTKVGQAVWKKVAFYTQSSARTGTAAL